MNIVMETIMNEKEETGLRFIERQLKVSRHYIIETLVLYDVTIEQLMRYIRKKPVVKNQMLLKI